jgi:hypothetical protein
MLKEFDLDAALARNSKKTEEKLIDQNFIDNFLEQKLELLLKEKLNQTLK